MQTRVAGSPRAAFWADQLQRACFSRPAPPWHGPSLSAAVRVQAETAAARPLTGGHSIFELARHVALWNDAVRRRLEGDRSWVRSGADWRPVGDTSPEAWKRTVADLRSTSERLIEVVRGLDDEVLPLKLPGKSYTAEEMISGILQHTIYHAGQMKLLQKAARKTRR